MSTQKMKRIYLVGGEKGGVGKTFISRSLCQYLNSRGEAFSLVEADSQINDVGRIYQEQAVSTHTITLSDDPKRAAEPDVIVQAATAAPTIVNLPSNTLAVLENWMHQTNLLELMEEKFGGQHRLVKWFVSDGCHESIRQLEASIFALDRSIPHIVILNHGRLNGVDFSYLETNPTYQRLKEQPNFITEIEFPALENSVQFFVDENELTLADARERVSEEQGILAGQRIITFIRDFTEAFDSAIEALERSWTLPEMQKSDRKLEVEPTNQASDPEPIPEEQPTEAQIFVGIKKGKSDQANDPKPPENTAGQGFGAQSDDN
jgi:hypothetical protein